MSNGPVELNIQLYWSNGPVEKGENPGGLFANGLKDNWMCPTLFFFCILIGYWSFCTFLIPSNYSNIIIL